MMHWPVPLSRARVAARGCPSIAAPDPIGERLHAVVSEYARVKADAIRAREARVRGMIDALALTLEEARTQTES